MSGGITPFNPDSWMDVVALLGIAAIGLATTALPLWLKARSTGTKVTEIHEQTVNDHKEERNLRVQLDRMERDQRAFHEAVTGEIRGLRRDIGRLADAAVDDRAMHHKDIDRLDDDIDELRRRSA